MMLKTVILLSFLLPSVRAMAGEFHGQRAAKLIRAFRALGLPEKIENGKLTLDVGSIQCHHDSGYLGKPTDPKWALGERDCTLNGRDLSRVESDLAMSAMESACLPMDAEMGLWYVSAGSLTCTVLLDELDEQKRFVCSIAEEVPDPSYCSYF